jgi:excisionase family DNA binding protein
VSASAAVTLEGLVALASDPVRLAEVRPVLRLLAGIDDGVGDVPLQSTAAAAERLGFGPRAIERMARAGRLPGATKVGSQWRIPADAMPIAGDDVGADPSPAQARRAARRKPTARNPAAVGSSSVEAAIRGPRSGRVGRTTPRSAPASLAGDRGRGPMERDSMDTQDPSAPAGATVTPIHGRVTR